MIAQPRLRLHVYVTLAWLLFSMTGAVAQQLKDKGTISDITLTDAMGDSLLRSYSVDELLAYKHFYEDERAILENQRVSLREKGIRDLEAFIRSHPESNVLDKVIFRLAELHYEKSENEYLAAQEEYSRALDLVDAGKLAEAPAEPKKDFTRTLELYQSILDNFPRSQLQDDASYSIAFITEDLQNREEAIALYERFLEDYPDSRYVPEVLMRTAEYYFNPPVNQIEKAISIYNKIMSYTDSPKYNEALYKLGWSYYKLSEYPQAISYFTMLADDIARAEKYDPENKLSNPSLKEESIEYIGISFLDFTGVDGAEEYLKRIGGREYGFNVLKKIGDSYMDVKEEYEKAIHAYEVLLKLYPAAPDAPLIRAKIAEAYRFQDDNQKTYLMRKKLFADYHEGTTWWNSVTDQDARERALRLAEHALRANINMLLDRASKTENKNLYYQAVDDTREYLRAFPEDSNAVRLHWNMCVTLDSKLKESVSAYNEYIKISNLYWKSKFQKQAAKNAIALAQQLVRADTSRSKSALPLQIGDIRQQMQQDSTQLRRSLQLTPEPLTGGEENLVAAIDNYIKLFPFGDETPARLSQAGSIYYNKHDFVNALKYYKTLLKHFADHELAPEAEYLVMESYFGNLDFRSVEIVAKRMLNKEERPEYKSKAKQRLAEAIFLQAESFADESQHFRAAEEYSRVAAEVPNADFADLALFNSGLEYDRAREYSRAVEIYDRLAQTYTASKHYLPALNNMALDYRELKDFRNAAIVFERLAKEDTSRAKIETHLYNSSVSYVDAEDWERAIRVNQKFVEQFPASKDADDMFYNIANYYLKLNEFDKANEIYGQYAEKFPDSPRVVETHYRRGEYFLEKGQADLAKSEFQNALRKSNEFIKAAKDGNEYFAAEALFHLSELKLHDYEKIVFKLPPATLKASKKAKKTLLLDLVDGYTKVAAYGTIRLYESTYKIGYAYENFAKTWASQEIPETSEEKRIVARKEINQTAAELFERAVEAYKNSLIVLSRIAAQYKATLPADTAGTETAQKIESADTTLLVANRWIERSKEKISENIYDIAEINLTSVRELLNAPMPAGLDEVTRVEFRNQILAKFIAPLINEIVAAHVRNLNESAELGLENPWVEQSRSKVVTTNKILAEQYADLAWTSLRGYGARIEKYSETLPDDDVLALGISDEMATFIDFCRTHSANAVNAYGLTIQKAQQESIRNFELLRVEDDFLKFVYDFSVVTDSLAKVAGKQRKAFESKFRATKEALYEEALLVFEDNYFNLSEATKELLKSAYELGQSLKIENAYSDKIIQTLVRSDPEEYAGVLGLKLVELQVGSDSSWIASTAAGDDWTGAKFDDSHWSVPDQIDSTRGFAGYAVQRIWWTRPMGGGVRPGDSPADTAAAVPDSLARPDSVAAARIDDDSGSVAQAQPGALYIRKKIHINGLPVSGQLQIRSAQPYKLYLNNELLSEINATAGAEENRTHELTDFLVSGTNIICVHVENAAQTGAGFEALAFFKTVPGWAERQAEIAAQKKRQKENLLFDKGIIFK